MAHGARIRVITTALGMAWCFAMGCSDPVRGETGGTSGASGSGTGATGGATGGNGGGTGGGDAGSMADEVCERVARASCQKYSECLPAYVPLNFGDTETCVAQYKKILCLNRLGLEDSSVTLEAQEACAAATTTATCAQWFNNDVAVSACFFDKPGKRPRYAVCGTSQQCETNNCETSPESDCGTCGPPLKGPGAVCTVGTCAGNLQCLSGHCGLLRGQGEPCSTHLECQYEFQCVNFRCAVAPKAGEPCSTTSTTKPLPLGVKENWAADFHLYTLFHEG